MPYLLRSLPPSSGPRRDGTVRRCAVVLLVSVVVSVAFSGCSGCWKETDPAKRAADARKRLEDARKKKKEKEKKKQHEIGRLRPVPYDDHRSGGWIKPGNWISIEQAMRVHHADFEGEVSWSPVRKDGQRVALDRTGYQMSMSRPLYLAKKQKNRKQVGMTLFAPDAGSRSFFSVALKGSQSWSRRDTVDHLAPHQYFFVVLARTPADYTYLQYLDVVNPLAADALSGGELSHYRVLLPSTDRRIPIAASALTWFSTAHLLWDDVEPNRLSAEQQTAMVDWIHWGGNVLVSGPESLDSLRGSFLANYLPATSEGSVELTSDDLQAINQQWTEPYEVLRAKPLRAVRPWPAVALKRIDDSGAIRVLAETPGGEPLVVERRVGRGRVVVTAFRLSERDWRSWNGLDGFMNACLLRRGPREYHLEGEFDDLRIDWWDSSKGQRDEAARSDPQRTTHVRFFSRDSGYVHQGTDPSEVDRWGDALESDETEHSTGAGLGGWSDFNAVSNAARVTLRKAAGIEIPKASFVAGVLAAYLVVLIPANWLIFRFLGRIEWAWIAAPVIAIASAGVVIKLAQLDIGFARSNTEVAVVEIHSDYPRAHVTRFNALYTSLSTPYDIRFKDTDALVQPFAIDAHYALPHGTSASDVNYHLDDHVTMTGFHVLSNRTGLVHSEQMIDLGGGVTVEHGDDGRARVANGLRTAIHSAALMRHRDDGAIDWSWLGTVGPGETVTGAYESIAASDLFHQWQESRTREEGEEALVLGIDPLMAVGLQGDELDRGEVRLVGLLLDDALPRDTVSPAASQRKSVAMVVAHLSYGRFARPEPDRNCRADVRQKAKRLDVE